QDCPGRRVDGNSSGTVPSHSLLCWGALDFFFIVSWILIYRFRQMLRFSTRFAVWPLLPCRSDTGRGHLAKPKMQKLAVALFLMTTAARSHLRRNPMLIGPASLRRPSGRRPQNGRVGSYCLFPKDERSVLPSCQDEAAE